MRSIVRFFTYLAFFVFAGFLPFSSAVQARESAQALLEKLPEKQGGFTASRVHTYEDPGLGASRKYVSDSGILVDIYLFDLDAGTVPDGIASPIVKEAYDMARKDIESVGRTGAYRDIRLVSDSPVSFRRNNQESVSFLAAEFTFQVIEEKSQRARPVTSFLYVSGMSGYILKIRMTQPSAKLTSEEAVHLLEAFIEKLDR
jgi:hypothetical protein